MSSYKRVLCHMHMLLCLCRLCLLRRACTWVAYVNLNNEHNDDDVTFYPAYKSSAGHPSTV